ncbi:MAG: putative metal-binding motif-containing protein [Polyangiaceae bacterium]|nr:putative metal-binding motif-containing protein [Polyangiaceae bacterium]
MNGKRAWIFASVILAGGCDGESVEQTSSGGGSTITNSGGATTAVTSTGTGTGGAGAMTTTSAPPCDLGGPPNDIDNDGYSPEEGDCDDCSPFVNPGLPEVGHNEADDNCNGEVDEEPAPCDDNLALDSTDPMDAARAIELCKLATNDSNWGLVKAEWKMPSGEPLEMADPSVYHIGHGIVSDFGPNVLPKAGKSMLLLSSGTARRPTDAGYQSPEGAERGYANQYPLGHPAETPPCPQQNIGAAFDGVALEVTLRLPPNAQSVYFRNNFYSWEMPNRLCTQYNDSFVCTATYNDNGVNIKDCLYDHFNNLFMVNTVQFRACDCGGPELCSFAMQTYDCQFGVEPLLGTGFETAGGPHGATGWLNATVPGMPGEELTLRFSVYDVSDGKGTSTGILDGFHWAGAKEGPRRLP